MTEAEIHKLALDILGGIAPEGDFNSLANDDELREVLDLDSMDFLNFIAALHQATGADIPEADYAKLANLDGVIAYLCKAGR